MEIWNMNSHQKQKVGFERLEADYLNNVRKNICKNHSICFLENTVILNVQINRHPQTRV